MFQRHLPPPSRRTPAVQQLPLKPTTPHVRARGRKTPGRPRPRSNRNERRIGVQRELSPDDDDEATPAATNLVLLLGGLRRGDSANVPAVRVGVGQGGGGGDRGRVGPSAFQDVHRQQVCCCSKWLVGSQRTSAAFFRGGLGRSGGSTAGWFVVGFFWSSGKSGTCRDARARSCSSRNRAKINKAIENTCCRPSLPTNWHPLWRGRAYLALPAVHASLTRRSLTALLFPLACREYGLHAIDLQRLNGDVAGVRVRKLKSRVVVALVKAKRGGAYGRASAWTKLQAAPEKPSD